MSIACPSVFLRMRRARLAACVLLLATALAALPGHAAASWREALPAAQPIGSVAAACANMDVKPMKPSSPSEKPKRARRSG